MPQEIDRITITRPSQEKLERQRLVQKAKELMETYPIGVPAIAIHYMPDSVVEAFEKDGVMIEAVRIENALAYLNNLSAEGDYLNTTAETRKAAIYFLSEAQKRGATHAIFMMG